MQRRGREGTHTPAGTVPLEVVREEIRGHGAAPVVVLVCSGPGGLLLAPIRPRTLLVRRLARTAPSATNMNLMKLERVGSVDEALALAPEMGMPEQNLMVGDREGHIGWTIFGRIPADTGPTARAQRRAPGRPRGPPAHRGSAGGAAVDRQRAGAAADRASSS